MFRSAVGAINTDDFTAVNRLVDGLRSSRGRGWSSGDRASPFMARLVLGLEVRGRAHPHADAPWSAAQAPVQDVQHVEASSADVPPRREDSVPEQRHVPDRP